MVVDSVGVTHEVIVVLHTTLPVTGLGESLYFLSKWVDGP